MRMFQMLLPGVSDYPLVIALEDDMFLENPNALYCFKSLLAGTYPFSYDKTNIALSYFWKEFRYGN